MKSLSGDSAGRLRPGGGVMPPGGVGSVMLPGLLGVAKNPLGSQVSPPGDAIPLPMLGKLVKHDVICGSRSAPGAVCQLRDSILQVIEYA